MSRCNRVPTSAPSRLGWGFAISLGWLTLAASNTLLAADEKAPDDRDYTERVRHLHQKFCFHAEPDR